MATWLGKAFTQVTRLVTSPEEAVAGAISIVAFLVHWLRRCSTGAIRIGASTCDTLRHWLKLSTDDDDVVVVAAAMKTENLGTQHDSIILPKIRSKHDLVLFDKIGQ